MSRIRVPAVLAALFALAPVMAQTARADFGVNLIVNPGAEANVGAPVSGWTATGAAESVSYSLGGGFPTAGSPGPPNRGDNFFAGGGGAASSLTQTITLTAADVLAVDAGIVNFSLSAYLGGFSSQDDNARLTTTFRDASNGILSSATIGPVFAAARGNVTGLLFRSTDGDVLAGTRSITVTLAFQRLEGSYDDGYADNTSLILTARAVPEPGSIALLGTGLLALAGYGRRRARGKRADQG